MHRSTVASAVACGLMALVGATAVPTTSTASTGGGATHAAATRVSTRTLLGALAVHAETPSGYVRSKFRLWTDADHDGCSTRAEVLLAEAVHRPSRGAGCRLVGGTWRSRYDGRTFTSSSALDIDHVVPLNETWQSGARRWTAATRKAYANDLGYAGTLIAVSASTNRSKGDREPQDWMPPKASYACTYVATWVTVKWRWHLAVNAREKSYLTSKLRSCGWPVVGRPARATVHRVASTGSGSGTTTGTAKEFANCTAMHGTYPHGVGLPGAVDHTSGTPVTNFQRSKALYDANRKSDRDHDGIACEAH